MLARYEHGADNELLGGWSRAQVTEDHGTKPDECDRDSDYPDRLSEPLFTEHEEDDDCDRETSSDHKCAISDGDWWSSVHRMVLGLTGIRCAFGMRRERNIRFGSPSPIADLRTLVSRGIF